MFSYGQEQTNSWNRTATLEAGTKISWNMRRVHQAVCVFGILLCEFAFFFF